MSCSKVDDLEDLADDLFEFDPVDQVREKASHDRLLRKQQKRDKINEKHLLKQELHPSPDDDTLVDFPIHSLQKPPGTHSIYVKTFGCSHNISDSEFMIGQLSAYGYHIVNSVE
jgi:threonylcarbamoyladenosine tRNA methylthiotransferase CDKAL1